MKLSPHAATIARQALAAVRKAAEEAEASGDIDTAITALMAVRDKTVGAAITLRAIGEETRHKALEQVA